VTIRYTDRGTDYDVTFADGKVITGQQYIDSEEYNDGWNYFSFTFRGGGMAVIIDLVIDPA